MKLFTNTNTKHDILCFELEKWGQNTNINIASAFFTDTDILKKFVNKNCNIKLVVRLSDGTDPYKLKDALNLKNTHIRFFTGKLFHPKLYIFENGQAILGSSNLTKSGIETNNELNISIPLDNPLYQELKNIFDHYWESANVLDEDVINKYIKIFENYKGNEANKIKFDINNKIESEIGKIILTDIIDLPKIKNKKMDYIEEFKKKYQLFLSNFSELRNYYEKNNRRKDTSNKIPLRIEIDQLFNWIRENKCHGDDYINSKIRTGNDLEKNCIFFINEYIDSEMEYFDIIKNESYPILTQTLDSENSIDNLTIDKLKEALFRLHSFHDQLRFFPGGFDSQFKLFINDNGIEKIKNSFKYILFNKEKNFMDKIANYLYNDKLKLNNFSDSCVKELYGWLNQEDIPIYNNRTFYSMKWLGFGNW